MSATVPLQARLQTLTKVVQNIFLTNATLHLLGSALTVSDSTTVAECLAAEATWSGYAAAELMAWTSPADPSGPIASTQAYATFEPSGSSGTVNVYGYFATDSTHEYFYFVEAFAAGAVAIAKGQPYMPTIQYQLLSEY